MFVYSYVMLCLFVANLDFGSSFAGLLCFQRAFRVTGAPKMGMKMIKASIRPRPPQPLATGTGLTGPVPDIAWLLAVPDRTGLVMQQRCAEEHSARIWPLPESK